MSPTNAPDGAPLSSSPLGKNEIMDPVAIRAVLKAAKSGDTTTLSSLIEKDKELLLARDKDGATPLHCAAWKGHAKAVELLLNLGAPVNDHSQNTHYGTTPLHAAAHGDQKEVVEILLRHGADLNAKNLDGRTPLQETTIHNARAAAKILNAHGAEK